MATHYRFVAWQVFTDGTRSIVEIIERAETCNHLSNRDVMKHFHDHVLTAHYVERQKSTDGGKTFRPVRWSRLKGEHLPCAVSDGESPFQSATREP